MKRILIIEDDRNTISNIKIGLSLVLFPLTKEDAIALCPAMEKEIKSKKVFKQKDFLKYILGERLLRRAIKKLKEACINVDTVSSSKDAKVKYPSKKYDCITLDGELEDKSSKSIFDIFSNKEIVLPYSNNDYFLDDASKAGFKNVFRKSVHSREETLKDPFLKKIAKLIQ